MIIRNLHLTHFRNYQDLELEFGGGVNCITGPNGSGKTNILDALHYLALTRGLRSNQDKFALKDGETYFFIRAAMEAEDHALDLQCNFVKGKGKKILINQRPLAKMSEHIGKVPLVAILPNDTELINGPSAIRRKFLDVLISQYNRSYLHHLIQYEKVLAQRNAQLKLFADRGGFDPDTLELWTTQLIPHAIAIHAERKGFLKEFLPVFRDFFGKIVGKSETPGLRYKSQVEQNTIEGWLALFQSYVPRDRVNLHTGAGIHRDDLVFEIDEASARNYGSQGQQKTFVIALKLSQYQLLKNHKMISPILLLDDIFDKLDEHRLGQIAQMLDREVEGQVFVTDTSEDRLKEIFSKSMDTEIRYFSTLDMDS